MWMSAGPWPTLLQEIDTPSEVLTKPGSGSISVPIMP
jgi:hypothetical protein